MLTRNTRLALAESLDRQAEYLGHRIAELKRDIARRAGRKVPALEAPAPADADWLRRLTGRSPIRKPLTESESDRWLHRLRSHTDRA